MAGVERSENPGPTMPPLRDFIHPSILPLQHYMCGIGTKSLPLKYRGEGRIAGVLRVYVDVNHLENE